jgi:hypothetical protein
MSSGLVNVQMGRALPFGSQSVMGPAANAGAQTSEHESRSRDLDDTNGLPWWARAVDLPDAFGGAIESMPFRQPQ